MFMRIVVTVGVLFLASTTKAQPTCTWTDNPIVAGQTPIKAQHLNEIRTCLDAVLANWPVGPPPPPPPPPPGSADFTLLNVRRYVSSIDISHWIEFDVQAHVTIDRMTIPIRIYYDGFFADCTGSVYDMEPGEREDETVIPSVCANSDVQWQAVEFMTPEERTCSGCRRYTFAELPTAARALTQEIEEQQMQDAIRRTP